MQSALFRISELKEAFVGASGVCEGFPVPDWDREYSNQALPELPDALGLYGSLGAVGVRTCGTPDADDVRFELSY